MSPDFLEKLLLLFCGSSLTLLGVLLKSWLDLKSTTSNRLFDERIFALKDVWGKLIDVKSKCDLKISLGYERWALKCFEDAKQASREFQTSINRAQIILNAPVIQALRNIDAYFYLFINMEEGVKTSDYINDLKALIGKLEKEIQKMMRQDIHTITLDLVSSDQNNLSITPKMKT